MPVVERDLTHFEVGDVTLRLGERVPSFTLVSSPSAIFGSFKYTLTFPLPNAYCVLLTGPDRPRPPHNNVVLHSEPFSFELKELDAKACHAVFAFPAPAKNAAHLDGADVRRELHLSWAEHVVLSVVETETDGTASTLIEDLPGRSYALTEYGFVRHWRRPRSALHLAGERAAPLDLTGRVFALHGTDAACYDAYDGDPLYKHTPFLICAPRPPADGSRMPSTHAIFHPTNTVGTWDVGRLRDDPWGYFRTYTQDYGGLEEWVLFGAGVREVVRTFAEIAGRPRLVGRDWLGYLASGMGLGESDDPVAQELLEGWPELCRKHDIPCSAMHLSSGYTVSPTDGNRYVFTMNTQRYPDFKSMVSKLHRAGIKTVPNIKPYVLLTHPHYAELYDTDALFHDPWTEKSVVTRIWSAAVGDNAKGSWIDMTSEAGRAWWARGVQSLIELGVDGMWDDNNEYFLHDDAFVSKNEMPGPMASSADGPVKIGLMGRMINTELMNKVSHDTLLAARPNRRPYVITRSANVGTLKYSNSTWSGDNETSWRNLRGSQAIQLNAGLALMQSYGSDVGGFGGPLPDPELFVRWVQLGVTHSRFCIHSYKPDARDRSGAARTNTPWMYPEVLPIIRDAIKWRYQYLPFFNTLMWESHLHATPPLAPLFFGPFAADPMLYTEDALEGFDAWIGVGQLLSAPALHAGQRTHTVYFPCAGADDESTYFDLHVPHAQHAAGSTATIDTPLAHMGLFAREGAVIPLGRDCATVTAADGPARTHADGVEVLLQSEGGVVALDDWRAVMLFPGTTGRSYTGTWTEDDGVSAEPELAIVKITYVGREDVVEVHTRWTEHAFKPLWGGTLRVLLPVGDARLVEGSVGMEEWEGRTVHVVEMV